MRAEDILPLRLKFFLVRPDMTTTISETVRLTNKRGLHARASHKFIECALEFKAEVQVRSHNDVCAETVIADSVMELLLLGSAFGEDITISANGPDAEAAVQALTALVNDRFGETD